MATAVTSGCDNGGSDLGEVDDDRVDGCDINDGDGVDPGGPIGGDDPVCSLVDLSCSDQWRRAGGSSGGALLIDLL
ncbi:MAG: hypothetical protein K0V04_17250, partial [Deltaproteobacteria bacterium]|nr:hypothetical protein [Deltaproteobacteria bacterium]